MSFSPSLDGTRNLIKKTDGLQKFNSSNENNGEEHQQRVPVMNQLPIQLSEEDNLFFEHIKKKLEVLNKRRHLHPIEIIKFVRSKVSFAQIMKLHDNAELSKMDYENQLKIHESRFKKLERRNDELMNELREIKKRS